MSKRYLQTNGKLKESSVMTYAFNIPAVDTCPNAGACKAYCFAAIEQRQYPQAREHRIASLALSKSTEFISVIMAELQLLRTKHKRTNTKFAIRIHASGDFYSLGYMLTWFGIAGLNPDIQFYAYTKSIAMAKKLMARKPVNMVLIYSIGGQLDSLIDINTDRHARIFENEQSAIEAGYNVAASEDDTEAWQNSNHKVGLVIFGARKRAFNKPQTPHGARRKQFNVA